MTNCNQHFKAELEFAIGLRQAGQGDCTNGELHVSRALDLNPSFVGEIGLLIPDWAMKQTWLAPIDMARASLNVLPRNIVRSGRLQGHVLSQVYVAQAFEDYRTGHPIRAAKGVLSGLRHDPSILKNKGVLSILLRSLFYPRTANLRSASIKPKPDDSIPVPITHAIESTLGRPIDYIERVTTTNLRIYMIRSGEREFVLHIFDGGKDVLERRLAITKYVQAVGVPVPAPVATSISLPVRGDAINWLLEEKMPGSRFVPENMSQTDQLNIMTELGRFLRQLHSIRVTGFGPIRSANLDGPYPTFEDWLSSHQKTVARSYFAGPLSETTLPLLDKAYTFLQEAYQGPPVLCHCELSSGNILISEGSVSALIDWESATGTDPAYDMAVLFTTMSRYWYPQQEHLILAALLDSYRPDEPENFSRRVMAYRLLFIASGITWLMQYGEKYFHILTSIMSETGLN